MESDELIIEQKPLILEPEELPLQEPQDSSASDWVDFYIDDEAEEEPTPTFEEEPSPAAAKPISLVARFDLDDPECTTLTVAELPTSTGAGTTLTDFVHKCHFCVSRFAAMDGQFRGHVAKHARLECGACEERFHLDSERSWHRHFVHGEEVDWEEEELGMLYICKCCHLRFENDDDILWHFNDCHRDYIAAIFPERMEALDTLVARKNTEEKSTKTSTKHFCWMCSLFIFGTNHIEAHLEMHKNREIVKPSLQLRDFRCTECSEEFFSKDNLAIHLIDHFCVKNPLKIKCSFCSKEFPTNEELKLHIRRSYALPNPIRCSLCDDTTLPRAEQYWVHLRTEHGAVKGFPCGKCDQVFRSALECTNHDEESHPLPVLDEVRRAERKRKLVQQQLARRLPARRTGTYGTLGENGKNRAIYVKKV